MVGLLDVLLRGFLLVLTSLVLRGAVWARLVLGAEPGAKPDPAVRLALRVAAGAAALTAAVQLGLATLTLSRLGGALLAVGIPLIFYREG